MKSEIQDYKKEEENRREKNIEGESKSIKLIKKRVWSQVYIDMPIKSKPNLNIINYIKIMVEFWLRSIKSKILI